MNGMELMLQTTGKEEHFDILNFQLESGVVMPCLRIAYVRYGKLNAARDNLLLVMPGTANTRHSAGGHVGPGLAYDSEKYCVICTDGIGGGQSSRPGEGLGADFPKYGIRDMAHAHYRLATEGFGLGDTPVAVVAGSSMGAFQALEYAINYPSHAHKAVLLVPVAKTGALFRSIAARMLDIVSLDPRWESGLYTESPSTGLHVAGRHYYPWTVSDAWMEAAGAEAAEAACTAAGEWFAQWDAWDLIRRYQASASHDVSAPFDGDMNEALAKVKAQTLVVACAQDRLLGSGEGRVIAEGVEDCVYAEFESPRGHIAWRPVPGSPETQFITRHVRDFLGLSSPSQTSAGGLDVHPAGEG